MIMECLSSSLSSFRGCCTSRVSDKLSMLLLSSEELSEDSDSLGCWLLVLFD